MNKFIERVLGSCQVYTREEMMERRQERETSHMQTNRNQRPRCKRAIDPECLMILLSMMPEIAKSRLSSIISFVSLGSLSYCSEAGLKSEREGERRKTDGRERQKTRDEGNDLRPLSDAARKHLTRLSLSGST
eukprot:758458-Hanusia_phi.AAC.3